MIGKVEGPSDDRRIFPLLVVFRWASLIPALWLAIRPGTNTALFSPGLTLLIAAGFALLVMVFHRTLNQWLIQYPRLLAVDLVFVAGLLAISGGTRSPYFLYALSPLLAGAFFFQMGGAVMVASSFTPLYLISIFVAPQIQPVLLDPAQFFSQLAGIWLIPVLFGYPSQLLKSLSASSQDIAKMHAELSQQHGELEKANRQLKIIHDLTMLLQAAPDIATVQERVLKAVTGELGFACAVVGLVDPVNLELGEWQLRSTDEVENAPISNLPLVAESGSLVESLLEQRVENFAIGRAVSSDEALNQWLGKHSWLSLPLNLREHVVGVLLVAVDDFPEGLTADQKGMLDVVAGQAAVALGTTMVCIDRTRRLAVEQERNRIARDIHDTVSQSLFGIVFTLDACVEMLPGQPDLVRQELLELRQLASEVRSEVRHSIFDLWPAELDVERFKADLISSASQCCRPLPFQVGFDIRWRFERLPAQIRRTLYRVAQEALANTARHAGVSFAQVYMSVEDEGVRLMMSDQGRGFDLKEALAQSQDRDHFGLPGMQDRVQALGGTCEIISRPDHGTKILVDLPLHGEFLDD